MKAKLIFMVSSIAVRIAAESIDLSETTVESVLPSPVRAFPHAQIMKKSSTESVISVEFRFMATMVNDDTSDVRQGTADMAEVH